MAKLRIRIQPEFLGPVSVGTISPVHILREELAISLREAKEYVDRCVFDGGVVEIDVASIDAAHRIADRLASTASPPTIEVEVLP